jgi:hypothetical protein
MRRRAVNRFVAGPSARLGMINLGWACAALKRRSSTVVRAAGELKAKVNVKVKVKI